MSRILEALKKAMPSVRADVSASETLKPLIFEKVSFETPTPQTIRRSALNERAPRPVVSEESIRFIWVLSALLVACLAAVWLWPKTAESPKGMAEESVRLHERVADLETALVNKQTEIDRIQAAPKPASSIHLNGELESTRAEVRRLNRQLAVMLQDNLEKDQEIAKLSGRL